MFSFKMNGRLASITYRCTPRAMRRIVASASGRSRSKMLGVGMDQLMHSAAVRQGLSARDLTPVEPGAPCVGAGQTIGLPSRRARMYSRSRVVGAP